MRYLLYPAALLISAATAQAAILATGANSLSGTTSAAEPQLAGTIVEDVVDPITWTSAGGTLSADIQSRVVQSIDGTYDFSWRIRNVSFNGTGNPLEIGNFRIGEFGIPIAGLNGNFRTDGLGSIGPDSAFVFAGTIADYVNFTFGADQVGAGEESYFMFLDTQATRYARTAFFDVANLSTTQASGIYTTFGVGVAAVPEPATWALMILGFGLVGGAMRTAKRRRPKTRVGVSFS